MLLLVTRDLLVDTSLLSVMRAMYFAEFVENLEEVAALDYVRMSCEFDTSGQKLEFLRQYGTETCLIMAGPVRSHLAPRLPSPAHAL